MENGDKFGDEVLDADVNFIDMITPVARNKCHFEVQLAFMTFDWFLAEKIASNETSIDNLDDEHKLQVTLSIYPQQVTLIHLIIMSTNKEDQSRQAA